MKNPEQQASRWLRQVEHDWTVAESDFQRDFYSDCCFMCEQAAQKAMKAFLYAQGERAIAEHSIGGLMKRAITYERDFQLLLEKARMLDQYYIPTRYPDAMADPAVPFESYAREQASQALAFAREIVDLVKRKIGSPS